MAVITLDIAARPNQGPTSTGWGSVSLAYNELYEFTIADFTTNTNPPYQDPENDPLEAVKITVLPTQGQLLLDSDPVTVGQDISASDIIAGNFKYQADVADTDGYENDAMMFRVSDTGSSTFISPGAKFIFEVAAIENQPPSEVGDGSMELEYGEIGVFTRAMFTTGTTPPYADPEGDAALNLRITGLPTLGEIRLNNVPVIVNQVISFTNIDNELLTYVPDLADTDGDMQGFTFEIADEGSLEYTS